MAVDKDEFFRLLAVAAKAADVPQLRDCAVDALRLLGIRKAYLLAPITADPRIGRVVTSFGLSSVWARNYQRWLHRCDPWPGLSLEHTSGFFWPDAIDEKALAPNQRRYLALASRYGLGRGIGTSCFGPYGRSGFLGAVWEKQSPPDEATINMVMLIGSLAFRRYCMLVRDMTERPALSKRELEVLSWMCTGRSNKVIAEILGIARSSVDVYVRRIFAKLGATDRTAACLRAYSLGLTVTEDFDKLVAMAHEH